MTRQSSIVKSDGRLYEHPSGFPLRTMEGYDEKTPLDLVVMTNNCGQPIYKAYGHEIYHNRATASVHLFKTETGTIVETRKDVPAILSTSITMRKNGSVSWTVAVDRTIPTLPT